MGRGVAHTFAKDSLDVSAEIGAVAILENIIPLERQQSLK